MGYAKLDDRLPHHRKVREIAPKLVVAAYGLYVASVQFAQRDETDGRIGVADLLVILPTAPRSQLRTLAVELVRVHLWEVHPDGGWLIHDYLDHNLSAEERRIGSLANKVRQERYRERLRHTSPDGVSHTPRNVSRDASRDASVTGPTPLHSSPLHSSPKRRNASPGPDALPPTDDLAISRFEPDTPSVEAVQAIVKGVAQRIGLDP